MKKPFAMILVAASVSAGAQQAPDLNKPYVKDGKTYTYQPGMPYVDRGQLRNAQPQFKREPSPAEQAVQKVIDSPIRPTIINGQPGVQYHKSTK